MTRHPREYHPAFNREERGRLRCGAAPEDPVLSEKSCCSGQHGYNI